MLDPSFAIVDDHKLVRDGIDAALIPFMKQKGRQYSSGGDFISSTKDNEMPPDLVLLDFNMPVVSGSEALTEMLKRWPTMKVIMVTNEKSPEVITDCIMKGAKGYLLKEECSARFLAESMKNVLSGQKPMSAQAQSIFDRHRHLSTPKESVRSANPFDLRRREVQILKLVAQNLQNKEIATQLGLSVNSVRGYRRSAMSKAGVHNILDISQLVVSANL